MKKKNMVKWIAAIATLTGMLAGCGSSSTSGSGKVDISMDIFSTASPAVKQVIDKKVIPDFEKAHPSIKVHMNYIADYTQVEQQQMTAGAGPDVILSPGPGTLRQFASAGWLLPLTKYEKKYNWDKTFQPWALQSGKVKGTLYGVPSQIETMTVYYNKDLFKKNGWEIPQNYDELISLCKKMQAKGIVPFAFGNSDFKQASEWWLTEAFNESLGADEFKKVLTGDQKWNSPEMSKALDQLVSMWKAGYINKKSSAAISIGDATNLFNQGKAAMKMEGTWLLSNLIIDGSKPPFDWGQFLMPTWSDTAKANAPLALGMGVGINKNSKHPDETAEFINYFFADTNVANEQVPTSYFYPINGVDPSKAKGTDSHILDHYKIIDDAIKNNNIGYASWVYWPEDVETYLWNNLDSVYLGQLSEKDYLDKAEQIAEKDKQDGKLYDFSN